MTAKVPAIVAHRGLGFGHRENTTAAFAAVRAMGTIGVELDVRLTRDLVPVIHHDRDVESLEGRRSPIDRLLRKDLPAYLPTLAEALDALGDEVPIELEIKPTRRSIRPALDALDALAASSNGRRVRVSSFALAVLDEARVLAPSIPRALLLEEGARVEGALPAAARVGAEGMHVHVSHLSARHVALLRDAGLAVRAYTLDAEAEWRDALALGIDAIITDRPRALASYLREHAPPLSGAPPRAE
jgi:glycerophosphoryl diester phosphodiesterase